MGSADNRAGEARSDGGRVGGAERVSYITPACELGARACWVPKGSERSLQTLRALLGLPRLHPSPLRAPEERKVQAENWEAWPWGCRTHCMSLPVSSPP